MTSPRKTFDKADLLTFLTETGDEATVGSFTVIRPSLTLFGETESTTHEVQAITEAFWCEGYQLALVIQRARVCDGGANALPLHHPLAVAHRTGKSEPRVNMRYGGTSSQLVRWAAELADTWRGEIAALVPVAPIDWTKRGEEEEESAALVTAEPEPPTEQIAEELAAPDDDHTPTGESIDDVLSQHSGDEETPAP